MRQNAFLLAVWLLVPAATALADEADAVLGVWVTRDEGDGYAHIEIIRNGNEFDGRIVWLSEPNYPPDDEGGMGGQPKVDRENPDPKLRQRPLLGLELMRGFRYAGDDLWKSGRIYDPETGKTYKGKMRLTPQNTLKLRGYVGISLLGRTTEWRHAPSRDSAE